jgi:CIC family chloride channel protein
VLLILLKMSVAAVSLGSGFRGGLFFASLLLSTLVGSLYADISAWITARQTIATSVATLAVMASLGTGILGAPVAMTALALETTGDFSITVAALIAATIASLILRETFGYSFATWRFHLRGEAIRGPHDVGWIRDLTVSKLMRRDLPTMPEDRSLGEANTSSPRVQRSNSRSWIHIKNMGASFLLLNFLAPSLMNSSRSVCSDAIRNNI